MPEMSEQQKELLETHRNQSVDITKSLKQSEIISIQQNGKLKDFPFSVELIDSIIFKHPKNITVSKLIETENYFYINNLVQSPVHNNVAQFNKDGTFIKSFGRKGRGPGEKTGIGVLVERSDTTFLFDNGYLKKFNKELTEFDREFIGLWANKAYINNNNFDLNISANEYFPYPVTIINMDDYSIKLSLKDNRSDVFKTTTTNSNTFFSNENLIIYAKTTLNLIHVLKKEDKSVTHYEIRSDIIRENKKSLREDASPDEFVDFLETLFVTEKLHFHDQILWILFRDGTDDNMKRYLAKVSNFFSQEGELTFDMYDLTKLKNNYNLNFRENHLNLSKRNESQGETTLYQIKLDQI